MPLLQNSPINWLHYAAGLRFDPPCHLLSEYWYNRSFLASAGVLKSLLSTPFSGSPGPCRVGAKIVSKDFAFELRHHPALAPGLDLDQESLCSRIRQVKTFDPQKWAELRINGKLLSRICLSNVQSLIRFVCSVQLLAVVRLNPRIGCGSQHQQDHSS